MKFSVYVASIMWPIEHIVLECSLPRINEEILLSLFLMMDGRAKNHNNIAGLIIIFILCYYYSAFMHITNSTLS